jgi:membrane peptidoglycan carboxypeptidase
VAKRLEGFLSKDRILEIYLNVAEWGPGIFGVQAAARAYFGRDAGDLTLRQAAALAATLPHPLTSNPSFHPGRMEWRRNVLLERLRGPPVPPETDAILPDSEKLSAPDSGVPVLPDTLTSGPSWTTYP